MPATWVLAMLGGLLVVAVTVLRPEAGLLFLVAAMLLSPEIHVPLP